MADWLSRVRNAVLPPKVSPPRAPANTVVPAPKTEKHSGVLGFFESGFEKVVDNPATRNLKHLISDPKDAVRDATREGLKLAYHGAEKLIPDGTMNVALTATEGGMKVLAKGVSLVAGKDSNAAAIFNDLARVDWQGIHRDQGLKADWFKLWGTWLFEEKPKSLGTWDKTADGKDRVTVTDPAYLEDLASRPHQAEAQADFLKKFPNPKPGDTLTVPYRFTGPGTAVDGQYTAVEWFIGSYDTKVTCKSVDPVTGKAELEFEVTNQSHWWSASRTPSSFQEKGLPENVINDRPRDTGFGLGGNFVQRYVWSKSVDVPKQPAPAVS